MEVLKNIPEALKGLIPAIDTPFKMAVVIGIMLLIWVIWLVSFYGNMAKNQDVPVKTVLFVIYSIFTVLMIISYLSLYGFAGGGMLIAGALVFFFALRILGEL